MPCYGEAWLLKRQRLMTESIYKEVVGTSAGDNGSAYFTILAWSKELACKIRSSVWILLKMACLTGCACVHGVLQRKACGTCKPSSSRAMTT